MAIKRTQNSIMAPWLDLGSFVDFLANKGIERFEDATKTDFGQFLLTKRSQNTRNLFIFIIKNFKNYL